MLFVRQNPRMPVQFLKLLRSQRSYHSGAFAVTQGLESTNQDFFNLSCLLGILNFFLLNYYCSCLDRRRSFGFYLNIIHFLMRILAL